MIDPQGNALAFEATKSARRGHVESYFVKLNSPDARSALWLKWTLFSQPHGATRAEVWAVVFRRGSAPRGFKRSMPLDAATMLRSPFELDFGGTRFDGVRSTGEVRTARGEVRWQFTLEPHVPSLRPYPFDWMYRAPVPETKITSPVPDALVRGEFTLDDERVDMSAWRGMQGHNWGRRHTRRYVWCQANGFDQAEDVVFEGFAGRLWRAGMELPWLTMAFVWVDGGWLRFDSPTGLLAAHTEASVMRWFFETRTDGFTLQGEARADIADSAGLHYANPSDPVTFCLNSKLATLTLRLIGPTGTRNFATSRAALELGWPSADHGVAMVA